MTPMEPSRTRERIARHIRNLGHPDTARARRAEGFLIHYYGSRALEALFEACRDENPAPALGRGPHNRMSPEMAKWRTIATRTGDRSHSPTRARKASLAPRPPCDFNHRYPPIHL